VSFKGHTTFTSNYRQNAGTHSDAVGWCTALQGRGFDSRWCHSNFSL